MNVLQHTRNERNPRLKQSRPDRSYRDTLLSALLQINAHPLGHNVKQVPPSNKKTPFLSHFFKLVGMQGKLVSVTTLFTIFTLHLHRNQYRRIAYFPFFLCPTLVTRRKISFSLSLPAQNLPSFFSIYKLFLV